jgi:hypothetical protein
MPYKIDPILYLKIMLDAVLGATLAMMGTLSLSRQGHAGNLLPSQDEMLAAALFVGLPSLLYTLKARIATGLPNLPPMGTPGTDTNPVKTQVTNSASDPIPTDEVKP